MPMLAPESDFPTALDPKETQGIQEAVENVYILLEMRYRTGNIISAAQIGEFRGYDEYTGADSVILDNGQPALITLIEDDNFKVLDAPAKEQKMG